jgi:hypothetical protein
LAACHYLNCAISCGIIIMVKSLSAFPDGGFVMSCIILSFTALNAFLTASAVS